MKLFICAVLLAIGFNCAAQYHGFVRVFDLQGNKVYKGRVVRITDSSLTLTGKRTVTFKATEIGMIKTKRSAGHNLAIGATAGFGTGVAVDIPLALAIGIAGAVGDDDGTGSAAWIVVPPAIGAVAGSIISFISSAVKNSQTYEIGGNLDVWRGFKEKFSPAPKPKESTFNKQQQNRLNAADSANSSYGGMPKQSVFNKQQQSRLNATDSAKSHFGNALQKNSEISVGASGIQPLGVFHNDYKTGFGFDLKYAYNFNERLALTVSVGYNSFSNRDGFSHYKYVPAKAGVRYRYHIFYIEPQLGSPLTCSGILYAAQIGVIPIKNLDVSLRFEAGTTLSANTHYINSGVFSLRVACRLPFNNR